MKRVRNWVGLTLLLLLAIASWEGYRLVWGKPANIHHFADRILIKRLQFFPEFLTFAGFIENTILDFHSDKLSDLSPAAASLLADQDLADYEMLQRYLNDELDEQEHLTLSFLQWELGSALESNAFPYNFNAAIYQGPYPANQISGAQSLPLMVLNGMQQVVDEKSAWRFLDRVAAIPDFIDSLIEALDYRDELQANPPQIIVQRTLEQVGGLTNTPAQDWSLHATLLGKVTELSLPADVRHRLETDSVALIRNEVIPAYQRLESKLGDIARRAPEDVGVWTLPNGNAYYQSMLYAQASTRKTPDEIHQLGLQLVESFGEELDLALQALGYAEGDIAHRIGQMMAEPGARYADSDAGRQEIIEDFTRIGEELRQATAVAFGMRPDAPVEVVRVPEYQQDGEALARYMPPSLDGSRPGRFMINLRAPAELERHGMRTLSAHEAVPGHHFERALTQNMAGLPNARKHALLSAYSEGWALYTEQLVYEMGLHDERSNVGRLQAMLFRAVRLVVDTGIHAKRWTREQAIDYMVANTGMPRVDVTTEIERYIAMPAQACSYMLGMQAIMSAREAARERLGSRFSLPDFHDSVLANGPLPLEVLTAQLAHSLN